MEEENYDKIISECTKEIESGGRYTAEALLLRATFYLLIGNATAAQPDLDRVINMQDANVKVGTRLGCKWRRKKTARHKPVSSSFPAQSQRSDQAGKHVHAAAAVAAVHTRLQHGGRDGHTQPRRVSPQGAGGRSRAEFSGRSLQSL